MSDVNLSSSPQFGTAEFDVEPGHCQFCNQAVGMQYYRVNQSMACASCADRFRHGLPQDSHGAFGRGILFGVGAALLGLILYATVGIVTGLEIGYVSLAVGYLVGKAIKKGSGGFGGRRYQIAAVLLTYAAVSMSAIPIAIHEFMQKPQAPQAQVITDGPQGTSTSPAAEPTSTEKSAEGKPAGLGSALVMLAFLGLASPFLGLADPLHGVIGLVILFVGIRIAWQTTAGEELTIDGPFENSGSLAAKASAP